MSRALTGTLRWAYSPELQRECWRARFSRAATIGPDGKRRAGKSPWIDLPPTILREDRAGAESFAASYAPRARAVNKDGTHATQTVETYVTTKWLPDRDGRVGSVADDRSRMRLHVLPTLGPVDVRTFTRDNVEQLRDELDRKIVSGDLAWKTAASVWTLVTNMCKDLVTAKKRHLRARDDNPAADVRPPDRGERRQKQWITPAEALRFFECAAVPLHVRRSVAISIYTAAREGELRCMQWGDGSVDLDTGIMSITQAWDRRAKHIKSTKSGESRRFRVEPALLPLLQAMHDETRGKGRVVPFGGKHAMAANLRRYLMRAGITRPELHVPTPTRKPLSLHDLRGVGLTWAAVRGDDPHTMRQRSGHKHLATLEIYITEADAIREGFGDVFPPMPRCLLGTGNGQKTIAAHDRAKNKRILATPTGIEPVLPT